MFSIKYDAVLNHVSNKKDDRYINNCRQQRGSAWDSCTYASLTRHPCKRNLYVRPADINRFKPAPCALLGNQLLETRIKHVHRLGREVSSSPNREPSSSVGALRVGGITCLEGFLLMRPTLDDVCRGSVPSVFTWGLSCQKLYNCRERMAGRGCVEDKAKRDKRWFGRETYLS